MTERIKLTEENLKDAHGWEMCENEALLILCDDVEQLKQQILDDQEKLEKIRDFVYNYEVPDYGFPWHLQLMEILGEK